VFSSFLSAGERHGYSSVDKVGGEHENRKERGKSNSDE
jgi:hypothetical protein